MYSLRKEGNYTNITAGNYTDLCYVHLIHKDDVEQLFSLIELMNSSDTEEYLMNADMAFFLLKPDKQFIIFDDLINNSNFKEDQKTTTAGDAFDVNVDFILNKDDYEQRTTLFRYLKHKELIAICFFQSGSMRIVGSLERGCDFKYNYESKDGVAKIDLSWQSQEPCLHLLGESSWMPTYPTPPGGNSNKPLTQPQWHKGLGNSNLSAPEEGDWRIAVDMTTGDFNRENYFNGTWQVVASDQKFI